MTFARGRLSTKPRFTVIVKARTKYPGACKLRYNLSRRVAHSVKGNSHRPAKAAGPVCLSLVPHTGLSGINGGAQPSRPVSRVLIAIP